jgi:hypothetical protein
MFDRRNVSSMASCDDFASAAGTLESTKIYLQAEIAAALHMSSVVATSEIIFKSGTEGYRQ